MRPPISKRKIKLIKSFMTLVLLLPLTAGFAAISPAKAHSIYKQFQKTTTISLPPLTIASNKEANAFWTGSFVIITRGMLNFANNSDELSLIIGHELAHWRGTRGELNADIRGFLYSKEAGFNPCRGLSIVQRFNNKKSASHPASAERHRRLMTYCRGV